MNSQKLLFHSLLLIPVFLFTILQFSESHGQELEDPPLVQTVKTFAEMRGRTVYERACIACHGKSGDGNGPAAKYLDPRPRNFTSGTYKFRSTPSGEQPTDEDLYRTITFGVPRTMMPAWKDLLTDEERSDVVTYLKLFSDKFEKFGQGTPIQIPSEPEVTPQSIAEGKSIYIIMECWACHGVSGAGDGKSANTLRDDWGYKIKPFNFTLGNYKGGKESNSIYKTFNTGLNGTPMPSYADTFIFAGDSMGDLSNLEEAYTADEIAALKAYLKDQPDEEELANLSEIELANLLNRRKWTLVHFVKSLSRKEGLFYRLFVEDTEVTK